MSHLRRAPVIGSRLALDLAQAALDRGLAQPISQDWRARVFELAEALYQSIRAQLSVPRYQAIRVGRGANLDTVDMPLNDRIWLSGQFANIRKLASEQDRLNVIEAVLNRTNPGPGGFLRRSRQFAPPAASRRGKGYENDPAHLESSLVGVRHPRRMDGHAAGLVASRGSVERCAASVALRRPRSRSAVPGARRLRRPTARKCASSSRADGAEVHGLLERPVPFESLEFDVPQSATGDGGLTLTWRGEPRPRRQRTRHAGSRSLAAEKIAPAAAEVQACHTRPRQAAGASF